MRKSQILSNRVNSNSLPSLSQVGSAPKLLKPTPVAVSEPQETVGATPVPEASSAPLPRPSALPSGMQKSSLSSLPAGMKKDRPVAASGVVAAAESGVVKRR